MTVEGPQAVLVTNNQLWDGRHRRAGAPGPAGPGPLGMFAVTVASVVQAAGLLGGRRSRGLTSLAGPEVVIEADTAQIPVGVDGEALVLDTPVRCASSAGCPAGPGAPVSAPGCLIPSRSWTGNGWGRWP